MASINVIQHKNASSNVFKAVLGVRTGSTVKIYPTSPGTATVYTSNSPVADCQFDLESGNFISGRANWDPWTAGAVATKTSAIMYGPASVVALVPASGVWTLEVTQ